jgi:hypothetical protein
VTAELLMLAGLGAFVYGVPLFFRWRERRRTK